MNQTNKEDIHASEQRLGRSAEGEKLPDLAFTGHLRTFTRGFAKSAQGIRILIILSLR